MALLLSSAVPAPRAARRLPTPLEEAGAALARGRHAAALRVVERASSALPADDDVAARLRLARGLGLWLSGRVRPGLLEIEKAAGRVRAPFSRVRALEALALVEWKGQQLGAARAHLEEALQVGALHAWPAGRARVLARLASVLRDGGDLDAALRRQREAVEAARADGRDDVVAEALCDWGAVLSASGCWEEAREQLAESAARFAESDDPRAHTRTGVERAMVELAAGDVACARRSLAEARAALCPEGSDPRTAAEIALLQADLLLAVGEPEGALQECSQAAAAFAAVGSSEGESRGRMRMTHCLMALGRPADALAHARRAMQCASPARPDLRAIALLALGRAQIAAQPAAAERSFAAAQACSSGRPAFVAAARLGTALARGRARHHPEVAAALAGLERWGDRRYLAQCLVAMDQLMGPETSADAPPSASQSAEDPAARALAAASVALASAEAWPAGWTAALRALLPVLPWTRAVLAGRPGWELRRDLDQARPLGADDLAWRLAARDGQPFLVDLAADPALRRHPQRVLHALGTSLVAPVRSGLTVQVDFREGRVVGERELGVLVLLARLIESHGPAADGADEGDEGDEGAPAPAAFAGIVGRCPAMRALLGEAARIPPLAPAVHVYGETGTGKERLARALHLSSGRAQGPLVAVNASSLSDELFESELFGHVKGAFTGALSDRRGLVSEAEGGTLFLDEVTDLSARGQVKLLRFLQEREYRRLGDPRTHRASLRVVTASNVPLEERVASGQFRGDLMYRLNQHVLALPPLRDRGDDIALLARHCLQQQGAEQGLRAPLLSREAAAVLRRYAWPGNVRELESEMGRALVRSGGATVRPEHLSLPLTRPAPAAVPLRQAVSAFEREHIARALGRNGGNRSRTAVELGLSRQALLAKIGRLGIAIAAPR